MSRIERVRELYRSKETPFDNLWAWAVRGDSRRERYLRFRVLQHWAADRKRAEPDEAKAWEGRRVAYRKRKRAIWKRLNQPADQVPPVVGGWHPSAIRSQVQGGIGGFLNVPAKLVWHTTEGSSLPAYSGSHPHFTLDPRNGRLYQHIPITSGAMALRNLGGGVETNRAHAIQVELIGFAKDTQNWPDSAYAHIARLARWIEARAGVARRCSVRFVGGGATPHMSGETWNRYSGHCGHQHVPEQDHWDPGAFRIDKVV